MNSERAAFEAVYSTGESIIDAHSLAIRADGEYEQALARLCYKYFTKGWQAASATKVDGELLGLIERVKWLIDDGVRYQGSFSDMAAHTKAQADRARLADYLNGIRLHHPTNNDN